MKLLVKRWGNSLAVRLPKEVATRAELGEGSGLTLEMKGNAIVLTPDRRRPSLNELLADYERAGAQPELDWGESQGSEEW